jgi:hypothetical protein
MVTMKELRSSAYTISHPIKSIGAVSQTLTSLIHLMGEVFANVEILLRGSLTLHLSSLHQEIVED